MSISMSNVERAADSFSETLTIDEESAIPRLTAPPFTEFRGSPDDLMNDLQSFAKARGYSLRKKSTKKHSPPRIGVEVGVMIIGCSKGGKVQAPTGSKRKRPSKMTECPFRLTARENRGIWSLKLNCGDHNHVGLNATAHVPHRQMAMTEEKVERIQNATKCGIRPRQILNEFRSQSKIQGTECILKLKDIYNTKSVLRATELKNNTPTQALVLALRERQSWFHILEKDSVTSRITRLFLAHVPTARELLANNCQVITLDCTYKTNRYKMPLLNIVGQSCLGTSFNIGSCFLSGETQADYEWALKTGLQSFFTMLHLPSPAVWVTDREIALIRAIQLLHPGTSIVLCVWHINMDVRGYASKLLKQTELVNDLIKDWENVVYSNTDINYMDNWKKFEDRYTLSENHNHANPFLESEPGIPESHIDAAIAYQNLRKSYEQIIKYVQQTWLIPWRHYFVKCYTNKLLHLDTTTTQRAESAHRALKTQLGFSTGDLRTVVSSIELLLENQLDDLRQKLSSAKNVIAHQHRIPIFRKIINDVPAYGLWRVYSQYQKFLKSLEPNGQPLGICTGVFEMTMGLPCSHRIKELQLSGQVLKAEDLHPHWRYPKPRMLCLPANDESRTYITSDDVDSHSALDASVSTDDPPSQLQDEELDEVLNVEEPSIVRGKGRPKGSVNKRQKTFDNSTRREPSLFEIDQGSLSQPSRSTSRRSRGRQNAGPREPPSYSISGVPDNMLSSFRI